MSVRFLATWVVLFVVLLIDTKTRSFFCKVEVFNFAPCFAFSLAEHGFNRSSVGLVVEIPKITKITYI